MLIKFDELFYGSLSPFWLTYAFFPSFFLCCFLLFSFSRREWKEIYGESLYFRLLFFPNHWSNMKTNLIEMVKVYFKNFAENCRHELELLWLTNLHFFYYRIRRHKCVMSCLWRQSIRLSLWRSFVWGLQGKWTSNVVAIEPHFSEPCFCKSFAQSFIPLFVVEIPSIWNSSIFLLVSWDIDLKKTLRHKHANDVGISDKKVENFYSICEITKKISGKNPNENRTARQKKWEIKVIVLCQSF